MGLCGVPRAVHNSLQFNGGFQLLKEQLPRRRVRKEGEKRKFIYLLVWPTKEEEDEAAVAD